MSSISSNYRQEFPSIDPLPVAPAATFPLHDASTVKEAKKLLQQGYAIDTRNDKGETPLTVQTRRFLENPLDGNVKEVVIFLVENDLNFKNEESNIKLCNDIMNKFILANFFTHNDLFISNEEKIKLDKIYFQIISVFIKNEINNANCDQWLLKQILSYSLNFFLGNKNEFNNLLLAIRNSEPSTNLPFRIFKKAYNNLSYSNSLEDIDTNINILDYLIRLSGGTIDGYERKIKKYWKYYYTISISSDNTLSIGFTLNTHKALIERICKDTFRLQSLLQSGPTAYFDRIRRYVVREGDFALLSLLIKRSPHLTESPSDKKAIWKTEFLTRINN